MKKIEKKSEIVCCDSSQQDSENKIVSFAFNSLTNETFLNSTDVMKIFHISRSTLKRWISVYGFPSSVSPSGRKIWPSKMILDWALKNQLKPKNSKKNENVQKL